MSHDPSTARRPGTLCVHGGRRASRPGDPVVTPLVPSTNFRLDDRAYEVRRAGRTQDALIYARETNPTVEAAEARIAALEGAEKALLFASGTAALHAACLAELSSGDHVVAARDLYGGSLSMFGELLPRLGVEVTWVDVGDRGAIEAAIGERTRWVYCESISNPALAVADVPALAAAAHRAGARLVVDATFATPIVQRPLALGADLVMHSASKYLGGHNDLVAGVLCGSEADHAPCFDWRMRAGGCLDPHAAFLLERGLKTLALRVRAQCASAERIAAALEGHGAVESLCYPFRDGHPTGDVARRVLERGGAMISLVVAGGDGAAVQLMRGLEIVVEAASLGGVESLASVPATMSHVHVSPEERAAMGIPPGLVRISVGIEETEDLIADLEQALERLAVGEVHGGLRPR